MKHEKAELVVDMLPEIKDWLEYIQGETDKEVLSLLEISEVEQVYKIIERKG